jgi:hypothetical protein
MNLNVEKPLLPLSSGNILLVGVKASNLTDELRTHPRIVVWDSQNEHWTNKDMPTNVRVVFMTRFISHNTSVRILAEARKRQLLVFNPDGTGSIIRQVKELLSLTRVQNTEWNQPMPTTNTTTMNTTNESVNTTNESIQETTSMTKPYQPHNKLEPLVQFIDFTKSNTENARVLLEKAKELNITTTENSLANKVATLRTKQKSTSVPKPVLQKKTISPAVVSKMDVSVEILNNIIKDLTDMREFLILTVEENHLLRDRMNTLKKALGM